MFASEAGYDRFHGIDVKGWVDENVTKRGELADILRELGNIIIEGGGQSKLMVGKGLG